jgi:hypothetical protein
MTQSQIPISKSVIQDIKLIMVLNNQYFCVACLLASAWYGIYMDHDSICGEWTMEIYSVELDLGQLKIEVSVQNTSPRITFIDESVESDYAHCDLNFNVFLTAWDKEGRRLWRTPIMDKEGQPKVYESIDEALEDATCRFYEHTHKHPDV